MNQLRLLAVLPFIAGCASVDCCLVARRDAPDEATYVVIGIGLIRVPKVEAGVSTALVTALGVSAATQPGFRAVAGYMSSTDLIISRDAGDLLLEVGGCSTGIAVTKKTLTSTTRP